jgi:hypothetical protein
MNASSEANLMDTLTSALGGRRVYMFLWILWLLAALIGHYLQDMAKNGVTQWSTRRAFAMIVIALVIYLVLFLRSLTSREKRKGLLCKQAGLPEVGAGLRLLVWIVPIMALGALLAPAVIR